MTATIQFIQTVGFPLTGGGCNTRLINNFWGHGFAACDPLGGLGACPPENFENLHPQSDFGTFIVLLYSIKHEKKMPPQVPRGQDCGGRGWGKALPDLILLLLTS